jgi:hypothetical protein
MSRGQIAVGDCFRIGEVWKSPRGIFCRVVEISSQPSTLKGGSLAQDRSSADVHRGQRPQTAEGLGRS